VIRLFNQIRVVSALANADEEKKKLESCKTCPIRDECMAKYKGALCQKALSERLGIQPQALSRILKNDDIGLMEIFVLHDKPKRYPRKFIKLNEEVTLSEWFTKEV
jgi:hypothetical protein